MAKKVKYPPLTKRQQKLVADNVKFAVKISSAYKRYGHFDDIIAEGYVGLCIAAIKFDRKRNIKFTTYSVHWIRAMIMNYLLRTHCQMHILSGDRELFFSLLRAFNALKENPDDYATLAEKFGVTPESIALLAPRVTNRDLMLDAPLLGGRRTINMVDRDPLPDEIAAENEERRQLRERVEWALRRLKPRERSIIERRVMTTDKPWTLDELGVTMGGLSRERVRQIELEAKDKMRRLLLQAGLTPFPPFLAATTAMPAMTPAATAAVPQVRALRA